MFTGLIQAVGRIAEIESGKQDIRLRIDTESYRLKRSRLETVLRRAASVSRSRFTRGWLLGRCLPETLSLTTLGGKGIGIPSIWRRPLR